MPDKLYILMQDLEDGDIGCLYCHGAFTSREKEVDTSNVKGRTE